VKASAPIIFRQGTVGMLEDHASASGPIIIAAFLLFVGVNIAAAVHVALSAVPINALDEAAFDAERKVVVANARYAEIYGLPNDGESRLA
jgi:hypothetical protein